MNKLNTENNNIPDKYIWSPQYIGPIAAVAFITIFIFNKALFKIHYLEWGIGAFVAIVMLFFIVIRDRIKKKELIVIAVPFLWMGYGLIVTPFALNTEVHLSRLFLVMVLNIIAVFVIIALFSRDKLTEVVVVCTSLLWTGINVCFFLAWITGHYTYEKNDFAGIFRNRNEFAIQSVFLLVLLLYNVTGKRFIKITMVTLVGIMIAASLSVKGFLFFLFVLFYPKYLQVKPTKKIIIIFVGIITFAVSFLVMPRIQERIIRFSMVFTNQDDLRQSESAFLRSWLFVEGLNVAKKNPVFGVGINNAKLVLIPPFIALAGEDTGLYSHNNYIEMLLNAGVVGFLLYYIPLFLILYKVKECNTRYYVLLKTLIMFYLLIGMVMVQYDNLAMIMIYNLIIFIYMYNDDRCTTSASCVLPGRKKLLRC